ncbi:MAG: ABC transporter permease [Bacilli bacterium]
MKILNKLTIKHLKSNKKRTVVTIIGVMLSTALMVGIGLLFSTVRDNAIKIIEKDSGKYHASIEVDKNRLDVISKNVKVKDYMYTSLIGYAKEESITDHFKPYLKVLSANENYLKELKLKSGVLPTNENEVVISNHLFNDHEINLKVGDIITLDVGNRYFDSSIINEKFIEGETLKDIQTKKFKIVGICEKDILENYSDAGYSVFTTNSYTSKLNVFITYNKAKDTYKNTETMALNLGYKVINESKIKAFKEVNYHDDLLSLYGVTQYDNITSSFSLIICIILCLISVACVVVIYNSFAISVMERKKQFGLFSSIGATKKQLKHTVLFEAFLIGIIGIPLGILASFIGIGILLTVINYLMPVDMIGIKFALTAYPLFVFIPIIFMIITILISAYLPSKAASKISPIEAIRQNDDIKIKGNKIKSPKFINKIFGVEGDLAYKNMKRNKKKYRITIVSLFISIVLFISFSSVMNYVLKSMTDFTNLPEYEYITYIQSHNQNKVNEMTNNILNKQGIKQYNTYENLYFSTKKLSKAFYTKEFIDSGLYSERPDDYMNITLYKIDDKVYNDFVKKNKIKGNPPILLNSYKTITRDNNTRKSVNVTPFKSMPELGVFVFAEKNENNVLKDIYMATELPFGLETNNPSNTIDIIVNSETFDYYSSLRKGDTFTKTILLNANNYEEIDKYIKDFIEKNPEINADSINLKEELKTIMNMVLIAKILLYGFIALVTLIGVTSVLNTINTSIALRRKEFAMLRSMGLTPRGFNKILFFESLFFGLKSLIYAIPVSIVITICLHMALSGMVGFDKIMIPFTSIFISIIGVFIIILISMWYASRKVKKENILEAIREENI